MRKLGWTQPLALFLAGGIGVGLGACGGSDGPEEADSSDYGARGGRKGGHGGSSQASSGSGGVGGASSSAATGGASSSAAQASSSGSSSSTSGTSSASSASSGGAGGMATITLGPGDDYTKLEAAQAGDIVDVLPGTYHFRVYLSQQGTTAAPIVIRAADPANPPVWDLAGKSVDQWPGSYTGGDNDRGCWQVVGAHYEIERIEFRNCRNGINAAGIRTVGSIGLRLRGVFIHDSDDGFTGDGEDTAIEFSEIAHNGDPNASQETHNIYVYGGSFALRYSYVHDAEHGQNFHIRARDALLENNWIARAQNYEGDLMPNDNDANQAMTLRANVILPSANPENQSQVVAVANDNGGAGPGFKLVALWNTIIVQSGTNPSAFAMANGSFANAQLVVSNNIIFGTNTPYSLAVGTNNVAVSGTHNWMSSSATTGALVGTVKGASPGFANVAGLDFTLASGSSCIGSADGSVMGAPDHEYFENEVIKERYRLRAAHNDIGAFESTTSGPGFGF